MRGPACWERRRLEVTMLPVASAAVCWVQNVVVAFQGLCVLIGLGHHYLAAAGVSVHGWGLVCACLRLHQTRLHQTRSVLE